MAENNTNTQTDLSGTKGLQNAKSRFVTPSLNRVSALSEKIQGLTSKILEIKADKNRELEAQRAEEERIAAEKAAEEIAKVKKAEEEKAAKEKAEEKAKEEPAPNPVEEIKEVPAAAPVEEAKPLPEIKAEEQAPAAQPAKQPQPEKTPVVQTRIFTNTTNDTRPPRRDNRPQGSGAPQGGYNNNRPQGGQGGYNRPQGAQGGYNNNRPQGTGYNNGRPQQGGQGGYNRPQNGTQGGYNRPQGTGAPAGFNKPRVGAVPPPLPTAAKGFKGNAPVKKPSSPADDKKAQNKKSLIKKGFIVEDNIAVFEDDEDGDVTASGRYLKKRPKKNGFIQPTTTNIDNAVITSELISIKQLSEKIGKTGTEILKQLMLLGIMKTINDVIDFDTADLVASELGVKLEYKPEKTAEDKLQDIQDEADIDEEDNNSPRSPIITIMGHVDHGKTSLLDYIRKSSVATGEAGGITQHIGAYTVTLNGKNITFLDTPGHEAFTSMRMRGAQVTDIAIIVVAADDGIMPQTVEAINHAKLAGVSIIVAVNKIDKTGAQPDRVLQQLTEYDLVPEAWGGTIPVVKVSAKTGEGVNDLLETILLVADMLELKANPDRKARGSIIEAKLDVGKGPLATVLVQNGTLKVGDYVVAGVCTGKIRGMIDDKGRSVRTAGPSTPVSVLGFSEVPNAGDQIQAVEDERLAKQVASERSLKVKSEKNVVKAAASLDDIFAQIKKGETKTLNIIIKADVQGSVEAVKQSLLKLSNDEVSIAVIHGAVGAINESDVMLASTSGSIIIGFNVRPDSKAKANAERDNIDIRLYRIIYDAIDDVNSAIKGMLAPKFKENILGNAEVRQVYKITGVGAVAGCYVTDGKILRNAKVRLYRDNTFIYEGELSGLKRFKDDVKEVAKGYECGMSIVNYNDIKEGDVIEAYVMEQINE